MPTNMRFRILQNGMDLKGKRVLVRIDANVPIKGGKVVDGPHGKIARVAVDLEWLRQHGARIIVSTHLGNPKGKAVSAYSVRPVARRLVELLGGKITFVRAVTGVRVSRAVDKMKEGDIIVLENTRFDPREEKNDPIFAKALASFADLYVNDAFAVSHRAHASVAAVTKELPSYAGPLLISETNVLSKVMRAPRSPFVLFLGGKKMVSKIPMMENLLPRLDKMYVGGALANAFLKAQGYSVGASFYDEESIAQAKKLLELWPKKIILPQEVLVAKRFRKDARMRLTAVGKIHDHEMVVDVAPSFIETCVKGVHNAKTIIWNGPFCYTEITKFCEGTYGLARAIAKQNGSATTIVGGGDTVPLVETICLADRYSLLSTGGGAMLAYLAGQTLPGLQALNQ